MGLMLLYFYTDAFILKTKPPPDPQNNTTVLPFKLAQWFGRWGVQQKTNLVFITILLILNQNKRNLTCFYILSTFDQFFGTAKFAIFPFY